MKKNPKDLASIPAGVPAARDGPQSVGRILGVLEWLAEHRDGATLTELAGAVAAPKTSLVGLLAGLVGEGAVRRDESGRYSLGMRTLALAVRATSGRDLLALARPVMQALVDSTGETCALGTLAPDADMMIYVAKVESTNPIRYTLNVGERRELYCTAIGKAMLAYYEEERLARYIKSYPRQRYTPTTLVQAADLTRELKEIRRTGIALTHDERFPGASGVAAPIFSRDGKIVAALLVAGPSERMRANVASVREAVKRAAAECSRLADANS